MGINNTEQNTIYFLFPRWVDNGSCNSVFKLHIKVCYLVNTVMMFPTPQTVVYWIKDIQVLEKQPKEIQMSDKDGSVTIKAT